MRSQSPDGSLQWPDHLFDASLLSFTVCEVSSSKEWNRHRIRKASMRLLIDVTYYVTLQLASPIHVWWFAKEWVCKRHAKQESRLGEKFAIPFHVLLWGSTRLQIEGMWYSLCNRNSVRQRSESKHSKLSSSWLRKATQPAFRSLVSKDHHIICKTKKVVTL